MQRDKKFKNTYIKLLSGLYPNLKKEDVNTVYIYYEELQDDGISAADGLAKLGIDYMAHTANWFTILNQNRRLVLETFFTEHPEKIEKYYGDIAYQYSYPGKFSRVLMLEGIATSYNLPLLSYGDLHKWADSYGFSLENEEIKSALNQRVPNVLSDIISNYSVDRKILIQFILDKQYELFDELGITYILV